MLARLALGTLLLAGTLVSGAAPRRVYVVTWGNVVERSPERRALIEQADQQLREALTRRGAEVIEGQAGSAIVLKPSLEVFPQALGLRLVGVRDQKLLGSVSMKAAGSSRNAQLRALVSRACVEAEQL